MVCERGGQRVGFGGGHVFGYLSRVEADAVYWRIVLFGGFGEFVEFAVESEPVAGPLAGARGSD